MRLTAHSSEVHHAPADYLRECHLVSICPRLRLGLHQATMEVLCDRASGAGPIRRPSDVNRLVAQGAGAVQFGRLVALFARAPWSELALAQRWLTHFRTQLEPAIHAEHQRQRAARSKRRGHASRKATSVIGYLIYDDSTHIKRKGRKMKGLGRHYSTTEQKQVTGHSLFMGLHVVLGRRCPLPPQMYRTKAACQKEHSAFKSKVDLAYDSITSFAPLAGEHVHVLVDAWYTCQRLWKAARARGVDFSGGLKSNRKLP